MALLSAHQVKKTVSESEILVDVTFEVEPGEQVVLLGRSGAGKSTLLHILGALDPDYQGSVTVDGRALEAMSDAERSAFRCETLGFVFQAYNLLGHLSALENVCLPARFTHKPVDLERGRKMLTSVGLAHKASQIPATLSGGERQRVAMARALYQGPKLVLCDEPTGNLDRATGDEILALFDALRQDGVALLVATHDQAIAESADRVLTLEDGRVVS